MKLNLKVHLGSRYNTSPYQILFLKAESNYTHIYLNDGSKILSSTTLGTLEERLSSFRFFRANRSTLINLDHLHLLTVHYQDRIYLQTEESTKDIFLSRRRVGAFETFLKNEG